MPSIPANVIFLWTGTNGTIPSGWSRETTLDTRYPRGTPNATDPGGTGGALTHAHTTSNHSHNAAHVHTVPNSPAGVGNNARDNPATACPEAHTHDSNPNTTNPTASLANDTPGTSTDNHEPSYFAVIFIKSDGTPVGVPNNAVALWDNSAGTPTNWNLCDGGAGRPDMRNRWLKGAAAGGDGGGTGGNTTHTHTVNSHTHGTNFSHDHPTVTSSQKTQANQGGTISGGTVSMATATHTHALTIGNQATDAITGNTDSAAASDHQPPYRVEAFIQNNVGAASWPDRLIGLWLGTLASIPTNWKLCDGTNSTPDLRSTYVKGANTLGGIGGTGGSLTHGASHTATGHTHAVASHAHTVSAAAGAGANQTAGATNCATAVHTHSAWSNTGAASFTSGSGSPPVNNYTDTQPPYKDVAFIQWQEPPAFNAGRAKATHTVNYV